MCGEEFTERIEKNFTVKVSWNLLTQPEIDIFDFVFVFFFYLENSGNDIWMNECRKKTDQIGRESR